MTNKESKESKQKFLKREAIVLTKELKEEVNDRVMECLGAAKRIWGVTIEMPEIRFDIKTHLGGMAIPVMRRLRFNPIFLVENPQDYIRETVGHEVAHLIVPHVYKKPIDPEQTKIMSHGKEWRVIMEGLGIGPKEGETWKDINKHVYDVSSIEIAPKKKHGPRKPGGRKVGEIMMRIDALSDEEREALSTRLGMAVNKSQSSADRPLTKQELLAQKEGDALHSLLVNEFADISQHNTVSLAGWASCAIKSLQFSSVPKINKDKQ